MLPDRYVRRRSTQTQRITFVGFLVAALIAGGFLLYMAGRLLPLPGGKFLVMAPYLALVMFMAKDRLQSPWSMLLVSVIFGAVFSAVTPLMGMAILMTGLLSDLTGHLIPKHIHTGIRTCLAAALYPMWSFVLSFLVSDYLAGNVLFDRVGPGPLLASAVLVYALGLGGALLGLRLKRRMNRRALP